MRSTEKCSRCDLFWTTVSSPFKSWRERRLLGRLLHWDPERRPKATPDGDTGIRSYSFFKGSVDLEALEAKRLPPPFKPKAGGVEAAAAAAAAAGGPGGQAPPSNCPSFDDTEGLFDGF